MHDMKSSFNNWDRVNKVDLNTVVDLVLTNGTVDSIQSDNWLLNYIGDESDELKILDFGSGVGRNIFDFSINRPNWKFVGYDNRNMLHKANEYADKRFKGYSFNNIEFNDDWDLLKTIRFDCIYVTLVFQHIREEDLNEYLLDIRKMTNKLIVSGRRFNDDIIDGKYKNTWLILENNGFYPKNIDDINYKVEGDLNEHFTCVYEW